MVDLDWSKAMWTGGTPANSSMQIIIDGTPETPSSSSWVDTDTLRVAYTSVPSVSGVFKLLTQDNNLRSSDGSYARPTETTDFYP